MTLLKAFLLVLARRRHPEMFDGAAALASVNATLDEALAAHH